MSVDENFALDLVRAWMDTEDPARLAPAIEAMFDVVDELRSLGRPDLQSEIILANLLMASADQTKEIAELDDAILLLRQAAGEWEGHEPFSFLSRAFLARFELTAEQPDLEEAIEMLRWALNEMPIDDPQYPATVKDLLKLSWLPLSRFGDATELTVTIFVARRAISLMSDQNPDKPDLALNVATALWHRHERSGNAYDAALVIGACQEALRLPADPGTRTRLLALFADALESRYFRHQEPADLNAVIAIRRDILDRRSARRMFDLGSALRSRFQRDGRLDDLRETYELVQAAVDVATSGDADLGVYRAALMVCLGELSKSSGEVADRNKEIEVNRRIAHSLPADDPQRELFLSNLGHLLHNRYQDDGAADDLDESVSALRQAADIAARTGDVHIGDSTRVRLGFALLAVFERTSDLAALDEALAIGRGDGLHAVRHPHEDRVRTIPALPADDWRQGIRREGGKTRAALTSILAHTLCTRYEQTDDFADLDDALTLAMTASALVTEAEPDRRVEITTNLGRIHALRHLRTGDRTDLDRAVAAIDEVLALLPLGHPTRPVTLKSLTVLLTRRFHESQNPADIDRAIQAAGEALESAPADEPGDRARAQTALAHALLQRHGGLAHRMDTRARSDELTLIVDLARSAADDTAKTTAEYTSTAVDRFSVLMEALRLRHDNEPNSADFAEAIDLAKRILHAEGVSPSLRLQHAEACASWAASHAAWEAAADLYADCVGLMAKLASLDRHSETRRFWLARWSQLTRRASASALNAGDPQAAAVLLERGRGVMLAQRFDLREDLADLRAQDPDLADRFELLRRQIDDVPLLAAGPSPRLYALNAEPDAPDPGPQQRRLLRQHDELLAEIRSRPGFGSYLRPAQWADLTAQAGNGPLVMPNISEYRSDALIIDGTSIRTVQLPHATPSALHHAADSMLAALDRSKTAWRRRDRDAQLHAQSEIRAVLAWLWDAITGPVLSELDITGPPAPDQPWPRMWWVPTGLLSLLPLHAAQRGDQCALDRVISSYTPTVRALRVARNQKPDSDRSILAVAMPETPGASPLPFADREVAALAGRFKKIDALSGPEATRESVRDAMSKHTWAHFACHGLSDPADPGADLLVLHDHRDQPFTISEIADLHLDKVELAYLSACETARAADGLADESVHLGSAFQLAGYRHVIATLWTIRDDVGAELADNFYAHLLDEQSDPAAALHHACCQVRKKLGNFPALWASHLHIGP